VENTPPDICVREEALPRPATVMEPAADPNFCLICREVNSEEVLPVEPCHHTYHRTCGGHWLQECSKCPACKITVTAFAGSPVEEKVRDTNAEQSNFSRDAIMHELGPEGMAQQRAIEESIRTRARRSDAAAEPNQPAAAPSPAKPHQPHARRN